MADAPSDSFNSFLKIAIQRYWDQKGSSKVSFLALLLATREAWGVAWDNTINPEAGKKALGGAAAITAVTLLLRAVVGGPIGILLTGASVVSLVGVYVKNHGRIWKKVVRIRALVPDYRERHEKILSQHADGTFSGDQRDLMVDGLLSRFLGELDNGPEDEPEPKEAKAEASGFAAHVRKKSGEEDD